MDQLSQETIEPRDKYYRTIEPRDHESGRSGDQPEITKGIKKKDRQKKYEEEDIQATLGNRQRGVAASPTVHSLAPPHAFRAAQPNRQT